MRFLRLVRGVLATAAVWGVAWIPITAMTWGVAALLGAHGPALGDWRPIFVGAFVRGAISGAAFAIAFAIAGRRWRFSTLRMRQLATWGAVGGIVAPSITLGLFVLTTPTSLPWVSMALGLGFSGVLGAATATGALWIARRAPETESELLVSGSGVGFRNLAPEPDTE